MLEKSLLLQKSQKKEEMESKASSTAIFSKKVP
jgi:hypothetical protein